MVSLSELKAIDAMSGAKEVPAVGRQEGRATDKKARTIDGLADVARQARSAGKSVVLAHGVFDLIHMGHVRHLEAARREGDVLVVTVTADVHVNRGPGRPVFSEWQRAEMVAALEYVDWVAVNPAPTAVPVLETVQPDVFVKGSDYADADADVTGMIRVEQSVLETHGGRMVFTDEITFSSSALINSHLDIYSPAVRQCLDAHREAGSINQILDLVERVGDYRVLMIGDAIIDEYLYVSPMGKSPKENMIATRFEDREVFAGGVFAAANHIANFCAEVEIVSVLGGEDSYEDLIRTSLKDNVRLTVLTRDGVPTTRKSRFVDVAYKRKLFESYFMDDSPLATTLEDKLNALIADRAGDVDVVCVADFGHGLIGASTIDTVVAEARFLGIAAQSNSANLGYNLITRYPRADYVCIDEPEARLAVADKTAGIETVIRELLPPRIDCAKFIITQGNQGCVTYAPGEACTVIPAFTETVVDTMGAGDAFFAVTAPLVAAGGPMDLVGFIGNAVGATKVGIIGHRQSVDKAPLIKYLVTLLK